jgi:hypothetical protein
MAIWTAADKQALTITLKCKNITELSTLIRFYENESTNILNNEDKQYG